MMKHRNGLTFGRVIRERRRQLDLTQQEIAQKIALSTPYVGHLESGKRHPSQKVLISLAKVLGLDGRELFLMANPSAVEMLQSKEPDNNKLVWEEFRKDKQMQRTHHITSDEMNLLSAVALMGEVSSSQEYIYVLDVVRHVLGR
jgi:transcriptional regulator with XRE-family HTH domain